MTTEEILALADGLDRLVTYLAVHSMYPAACIDGAAALRQLAEEREQLKAELLATRSLLVVHAEERDREERLLRAGWTLDQVGDEGGTLCFRWLFKTKGLTSMKWKQAMHPDRAEATRLAEAKTK